MKNNDKKKKKKGEAKPLFEVRRYKTKNQIVQYVCSLHLMIGEKSSFLPLAFDSF